MDLWRILWHYRAELDVIQLKIGLPLNIDPNGGQNKFGGHISKIVAKMTILSPKIASAASACMQDTYARARTRPKSLRPSARDDSVSCIQHFGARASRGHNLAIFHQILTNEYTFAPRPHMGNVVPMD